MRNENNNNHKRLDKDGTHRGQFESARRKILATQEICGICGKAVDKSIKWPDPYAACIDHIIPIDKGGHPSDISNLQLAHNCCNRAKSDKLYRERVSLPLEGNTNRNLPLLIDWINYHS